MSATTGPTTKEILLDEIANSLGEDAIKTVEPVIVKAPIAKPPTPPTKSSCATQRPVPRNLKRGPANIMVGLKSECPRWVPGSVVRWAAWQNGFDSKDDAEFAAKQLAMAAETWNSHDLGISFEWVADAKDATFVLCHGGDKGSTLAQSFFPNDNDLNIFLVYAGAFVGAWKDNMWKVFTHELGHVMGLRHEFAMFPDENGEVMEGDAVQIGPQSPSSVMNYTGLPPEIQKSDVTSTKLFYGMKKPAQDKDLFIGLTVVKDYEPM